MGKGRSKNKPGRGGGNFAMLPHYLLKSAAWRDLDTNARALYVEILFRFNGTNNGSIGLGTREAGKALHVSKDTAIRAFDALVDHGLIVLATASTFNQKRLSREWLLTDHPDDRNGQGARKDFMKWGTEKQKIGASQGQIGASQGLCGNGVSRNEPDRRTTGTVKPPVQSLQAHHRDTYISNHGQNVGVGMAEVATATTGNGAQERRGRTHTTRDAPAPAQPSQQSSDEPVQVSHSLEALLDRLKTETVGRGHG